MIKNKTWAELTEDEINEERKLTAEELDAVNTFEHGRFNFAP